LPSSKTFLALERQLRWLQKTAIEVVTEIEARLIVAEAEEVSSPKKRKLGVL
jgi:hypothetical protein